MKICQQPRPLDTLDTKAAANTMVAFLLDAIGITTDKIQRVYMAGAFGTYINIESGIIIGLYPDLPRERFVQLGNGSIKGAYKLLKDAEQLLVVEELISSIAYLPLAEAPDFLNKMSAAKFLPHTDFSLYPTVIERIKSRKHLEEVDNEGGSDKDFVPLNERVKVVK
jgi:uncharacterized 2Fe-2S/4Fe-4S cluster protein (DUF4445 family)